MSRPCSGEWPRMPSRLADRRRFRFSNVLKTESSLPFEVTGAAFHRHETRSCEDGSEPTSPARTGPLETLGSGKIRSQRISQGLNVPTVLPTVGIATSGDQLSLPLYLLVRLFKLTTGSQWWMCSPIPLVDLGGRGCRHGPGSRNTTDPRVVQNSHKAGNSHRCREGAHSRSGRRRRIRSCDRASWWSSGFYPIGKSRPARRVRARVFSVSAPPVSSMLKSP